MKFKTKRERAELYKTAALILELNQLPEWALTDKQLKYYKSMQKTYETEFISSRYCCDILSGLTFLKNFNNIDRYTFPEFFMLKPDRIEGVSGWWEDYNTDVRVIAFLLAAELCN